MSEPQHAALLTAAKALVEAERASKAAEDALRRAHATCAHTDRDTHSNCVHAEIVFEREYRAAVSAERAVLAEARKATLAGEKAPKCTCATTGPGECPVFDVE